MALVETMENAIRQLRVFTGEHRVLSSIIFMLAIFVLGFLIVYLWNIFIKITRTKNKVALIRSVLITALPLIVFGCIGGVLLLCFDAIRDIEGMMLYSLVAGIGLTVIECIITARRKRCSEKDEDTSTLKIKVKPRKSRRR